MWAYFFIEHRGIARRWYCRWNPLKLSVKIFLIKIISTTMANFYWFLLKPEAGPALTGVGPNARPMRGASLSSGGITSASSVNRSMTFLRKIF